MKAVLISINPKWVEKIASGEKTIEVRKTMPKLERPFKVYIYATWNESKKEILVKQDGLLYCEDWRKANGLQRASGKVIGEFFCDEITEFGNNFFLPSMLWIEKEACLSGEEICKYLGEKESGFALHITDLKIYDKAKELSEFTPICKYKGERCEVCVFNEEAFGGCCRTLIRPPQSWCYVEELQNG